MISEYTKESIKKAMLEGRCGSTYEGHSPTDFVAYNTLGGGWGGFSADPDTTIYVGFLCKKCLTLVFVDESKLQYVAPPTPPMP